MLQQTGQIRYRQNLEMTSDDQQNRGKARYVKPSQVCVTSDTQRLSPLIGPNDVVCYGGM